MDRTSFYRFGLTSSLFSSIIISVGCAAGLRTMARPWTEDFEQEQMSKPKDFRLLRHKQYPNLSPNTLNKVGPEEVYMQLLELAILASKLLHLDKTKNEHTIGTLYCSREVVLYKRLPPGFVNIIYQKSEEFVHAMWETSLCDQATSLLLAEKHTFYMYLTRLQDEYGEDDEDLYGRENKSGNLCEAFYNCKQDLLNQIVDVLEDQLQYCSRVLRYKIRDLPSALETASRNIILSPKQVESLYKHGFCVLDNFISKKLVKRVYSKCLEFVGKTVATFGNQPPEKIDNPPKYIMYPGKPFSARGDMLSWLNEDIPPGSEPPLSEVFERYRIPQKDLNKIVYLLGGKESQMAYYPDKGRGYKRHRDAVPDDGSTPSNNRRITAITYCNPSWNESNGGKLRVWLGRNDSYNVLEIEPLPGRLILFLSGALDHEVRASFHHRVAITTWYW